MKKISLILLFLIGFYSNITAQKFMTESGSATFYSEVPLHTFSGSSQHLTGLIDLKEKIVDFYLDLNTLKTGIQKRDRDMLETLEADDYPFAEFYGKLITDYDSSSAEAQEVLVEGVFKIHGVERQRQFSGIIEKSSSGLLVTANWVLNLNDYNIIPPKLLFIKVDQEQKIEIEALLKPIEE